MPVRNSIKCKKKLPYYVTNHCCLAKQTRLTIWYSKNYLFFCHRGFSSSSREDVAGRLSWISRKSCCIDNPLRLKNVGTPEVNRPSKPYKFESKLYFQVADESHYAHGLCDFIEKKGHFISCLYKYCRGASPKAGSGCLKIHSLFRFPGHEEKIVCFRGTETKDNGWTSCQKTRRSFLAVP